MDRFQHPGNASVVKSADGGFGFTYDGSTSKALGAGLLLIAGLFQFSRLKSACLVHCRSIPSFSYKHCLRSEAVLARTARIPISDLTLFCFNTGKYAVPVRSDCRILKPECEKPQATITKFRFPNTKVTTKNLLYRRHQRKRRFEESSKLL